MENIIVLGHQNPDTDTIVSTIVYSQIKKKMGLNTKAGRLGEPNKETKFVLSFFKQEAPELIESVKEKQVVLLDHNEGSQSAVDIKEAEIIEIVDHHYIGNLSTPKPIYCRFEPIGSTSSIVFKLAQEKKIKLNKIQAGLLLAGLISDTLFLTSPTTTQEDKKIFKELVKISKVNAKKLADQMFQAKSDISGMDIKDIVKADYKEFSFKNTKIGIGVFETAKPEVMSPKDDKIFEELEKLKQDQKTDFCFFLVVDILKQNSVLYLIGQKEQEVAEQVFKGKMSGKKMLLPGVVSRKKQVLPPLAKHFE
jgi:manganese-dependent inorganic pyrophosphatase